MDEKPATITAKKENGQIKVQVEGTGGDMTELYGAITASVWSAAKDRGMTAAAAAGFLFNVVEAAIEATVTVGGI